jgi:hypothetical protein
MSDSQYWTSLWGVGIVIFLAFFIMFLGVGIFGILYDRISVWHIWNSPIWLTLKIPLIVIGVIGFIAGVISFARYQGQKELKAAREYSQSQGWGFSRDDTQGLKARIADIWCDFKFNLYYIRTVETGKRQLYLFDCSYKHKEASSRSHDSYGTACVVQSDRFRSVTVPVEIVTRDWTEVMISDKVEMGQSLFAEKFVVLSKNPGPAREIVNVSIQAIMLDHLKKPLYNPVGVSLGPGGAIVLTDRTLEHERLQDLLDLARQIEAAVE